MTQCKNHKSGTSLLEATIALAMIAITVTVLLANQGRAFSAGLRAIDEQKVILVLRREFTHIDTLDEEHKKPFTKPLPDHCPIGTMTFSIQTPSEKSALYAYNGIRIESLKAIWQSRGGEESIQLVRYRYKVAPKQNPQQEATTTPSSPAQLTQEAHEATRI